MFNKIHFSTAQCYDNCPHQFYLRYVLGLETIPDCDPQNPLILGTALHRGVETDLETAIDEYYNSYPVITDLHIEEAMKLEHWIPKLKELFPEGLHELSFSNPYYMGTADLLVPVDDNTYDLYDFKYSNNIEHYLESEQLHVYKHYLEWIKGIYIRKMYFVFIPKVRIRQGQKERQFDFRKRIMQELEKVYIKILEVSFDQTKVDDFHHTCMKIATDRSFKRNNTKLCDWCEFKDYCKKGQDYMILPSTERRSSKEITKKKIFIYGQSFSGKTTVCDDAPNPLNLNTDGNIEFVTMPYIHIGDKVTTEGRVTKKTFGWEILKEAIKELQKKDNDFQTIIIDLIEDAYEMCRLYMYDKLGIEHESDDAFRAWDKVRTEFFSSMREFFNLPYDNLIVISKEDMSRDITKKSGSKVTQVKPSLQDKIACKLAGMVDVVVRTTVSDDGSYTMNFKTDEFVFGGGRLKGVRATTIPTSWESLMQVYEDAKNPVAEVKEETPRRRTKKDEPIQVEIVEEAPVQTEEPEVDEPEPVQTEEQEPEEKPVRRRKVRRS